MLLFPLCWLIAGLGLRGRAWALFFIAIAGVQASFWFTVLHIEPPWMMHQQLVMHHPGALMYLVLLTVLVFGYALLAFLCMRVMARRSDPLM